MAPHLDLVLTTTPSSPSLPENFTETEPVLHHRHFLNTVEILRQSGVLDIRLHTKELLCQSHTTERDIGQLRQNTEQLCQAASNPTAWEHLHQSMTESVSYHDLKILWNVLSCNPDSASQTMFLQVMPAAQ